MGSVNSTVADEHFVEEGFSQLRGQLLDLRRVATLSFEEFNEYVSKLNAACRHLVDHNGNYLLFVVKSGSTDSVLWKATAAIYCLKISQSGRAVSSRCLDLPTFLCVQKSVLHLASSAESSCPAPSSSQMLSSPGLCSASRIFEKIDEQLDSEEICFQECCICMERKHEVILPCSHSFCLPCIEQWNVTNSFCPTCRAKLNSTDDAWVIADSPDRAEITDYVLGLVDKP